MVLADKARKMSIDRPVTGKKFLFIHVMRIIGHWVVGVLLLLNSVASSH